MRKLALSLIIGLTITPQVFAQNLIIDTKGIDQEKYSADMYQCQQLSDQVQEQNVEGTGRTTIKHMGRAAALGAGAAAIGGGSGSKGAGIGAGIGLVTGVLGSSAEKEQAQANYQGEKDTVMRNCMTERGYTILN
ncbi:glycine zipper family protein [Vibrio mediterranei]|uniref:glycine zipper family protein n=1 Tax=Vibrio mediterranei TaxID=689 RepID=UPI002284E973|nr:glycine zipper family protein [Vibrio mediterranei]MCY9854349.1 glycine zipper family protein [Vibrio mediterranei]